MGEGMTDDGPSAYVASLPEASGTFEGTLYPEAAGALEASVPDLMPVEISTGDKPLPVLIAFMTQLAIRAGGDEWVLPVDHVELHLAENRAVIWVRRRALPSPAGETGRTRS
jgi:hypothetical protein